MSCTACGVVDDRRFCIRIGPRTSLCSDCWRRQGRPGSIPADLSETELKDVIDYIRTLE